VTEGSGERREPAHQVASASGENTLLTPHPGFFVRPSRTQNDNAEGLIAMTIIKEAL